MTSYGEGMSRLHEIDQLRKVEPIVYQMASILLEHEEQTIAVTKAVLCKLWKEPCFFELDERKKQNRLIWLVSNESVAINISA